MSGGTESLLPALRWRVFFESPNRDGGLLHRVVIADTAETAACLCGGQPPHGFAYVYPAESGEQFTTASTHGRVQARRQPS